MTNVQCLMFNVQWGSWAILPDRSERGRYAALRRQLGFTLIEVLVTLTIILILAGALVGTGKYLRTRAERQLTRSAIEVICTALEQYYGQTTAFPVADVNFGWTGCTTQYTCVPNLGTVIGGTTEERQKNGVSFSNASSAALFYYLDHNKNCREIIGAISERLITNKDAQTGSPLKVSIGAETVDLPRFIDAWGTSLRYEYMDGYSFPKITSAGPDKKFDTKDDLSSQ